MNGRDAYLRLKPHIEVKEPVLVAFSGGLDSSVLLAAMVESGQEMIAATFSSILHPAEELGRARKLAAKLGVDHIVFKDDPISDKKFVSNSVTRCYNCKKRRLSLLRQIAEARSIKHIFEGVLASDKSQYRPGLKASEEFGVKAPLALAGFDKAKVISLAEYLGIDEWIVPSSSCLATRLEYGTEITEELIKQIDVAEGKIAEILTIQRGSFRVRVHGKSASLEVDRELFELVLDEPVREVIISTLKEIGFPFASLDLGGFKSGSMDRTHNNK